MYSLTSTSIQFAIPKIRDERDMHAMVSSRSRGKTDLQRGLPHCRLHGSLHVATSCLYHCGPLGGPRTELRVALTVALCSMDHHRCHLSPSSASIRRLFCLTSVMVMHNNCHDVHSIHMLSLTENRIIVVHQCMREFTRRIDARARSKID